MTQRQWYALVLERALVEDSDDTEVRVGQSTCVSPMLVEFHVSVKRIMDNNFGDEVIL
jgi:hypothetical protein